jgi:hypothetical protein
MLKSAAFALASALMLLVINPGTAMAGPASAPKLVGTPTVVASSYSLPGTTGWDTAVVFHVSNPTSGLVVNAPYRAAIYTATDPAQASSTATADGTVTLYPHEKRLVVATENPKGEQPTTAKVKLYSAPKPSPLAGKPSDPSKWKVSDPVVECPSGIAECYVTGDITWTGKGSTSSPKIMVAIHQGALNSPVIAAGDGSANGGTYQTGLTQPLGLLHGEVTSDLWCPWALLEGCAPCRGRIPESSVRT